MVSNASSGITLSRTHIPTLPTGYLSRRRLFPMIENVSSGTTFVVAPAGYGKSAVISEWAQSHKKSVIWMTVANSDTTNEMSAMLISATRRIIPEFAPWFEKDQPLRPTEIVRRWGNELLETGNEYIFVLDNLGNSKNEDVNIASKLIEQFPSNVHFVAIRTIEIPEIYGVCSSRGPIKFIGIEDLRFSDEEIIQFASNSHIELTKENLNLLSAGAGWPVVTSLLATYLQGGGDKNDIKGILSLGIEHLGPLVGVVLQGLPSEISEMCEDLAILEIFNLQEAQLILGDNFDQELINSVAHKGEIFRPLRSLGRYEFSPLVREVLLEKLTAKGAHKSKLHRKLLKYYEDQGDFSSAIDHAFAIGDQEKISELFPDASRLKQAKGKGGDLIRWAPMAAMSPEDGEAKRLTLLITGYLADLDFSAAKSEITKLELLAESAKNREFFYQFIAAASCYSLLSLGNFLDLEDAFKRARVGSTECQLGIDDQINLLRLLATKRYIWNDAEGVEEVYLQSRELAKLTTLLTSHTFLKSIQAMYLHQRGEYRSGYEVAIAAQSEYQKYGLVGNHGPLDVMYVSARCLLEFSKTREALDIFENIQRMASEWKQWHWYFVSEQHITEHLTYSGKHQEALTRISNARTKVQGILSPNRLQELCDIAEMNIRKNLEDFDRLEKLINRAPNIRHTRQMKLALDKYKGKKTVQADGNEFLKNIPRDLIWKYLLEASLNIDSEKVASMAMRKALEIGAEVGAKETFLRQKDELGNLVLRVANDYPTVYNEEIASAMAERMRERGSSMTEVHPNLTKRELEILRQLSTGRTLTIIASELHISQNTMKTHLKNLYKKMGADGRHDAVYKAKALFLI